MEQPYSNREIIEKFDHIKDILERIEVQTTKTNGRVTKLEGWRNYVSGIAACLLTLSGIIWYVTFYAYKGDLEAIKTSINSYILQTK